MGDITFIVKDRPGFKFSVHPEHDNWVMLLCTWVMLLCTEDDCEFEIIFKFLTDYEYTPGDLADIWDGVIMPPKNSSRTCTLCGAQVAWRPVSFIVDHRLCRVELPVCIQTECLVKRDATYVDHRENTHS